MCYSRDSWCCWQVSYSVIVCYIETLEAYWYLNVKWCMKKVRCRCQRVWRMQMMTPMWVPMSNSNGSKWSCINSLAMNGLHVGMEVVCHLHQNADTDTVYFFKDWVNKDDTLYSTTKKTVSLILNAIVPYAGEWLRKAAHVNNTCVSTLLQSDQWR